MTATCLVCDAPTENRRTTEINGVELRAPVCSNHRLADDALVEIVQGRPTPADLIQDLQRVSDDLGHSPTMREYEERGEYQYNHFYETFGSWNDAKTEAGMEKCDNSGKKIPDDAILADVRRVADELGEPPTMSEYGRADDRPVTMTTIYDRWDSWDDVLEEAFAATA